MNRSRSASAVRGLFVSLLGSKGLSRDFRSVGEYDSVAAHGFRPDYNSGPHLWLMAETVKLARSDLADPLYSAEAREFLAESPLVALFAECLGIEQEKFLDG